MNTDILFLRVEEEPEKRCYKRHILQACKVGWEWGACLAGDNRNVQEKEGGLVTGIFIIMQLNVSDLIIFPEPVLTIKETNF